MSNTADNSVSSTATTRIVRVRDLPIYYDMTLDDANTNRYLSQTENQKQKAATNEPGWLYSSISQTRQSVQQVWNDNKNLRERIARGIETGDAHTRATIDYIRDDETFLPKVGVVTVAGLGGLLLGHRGGPLRKTFYSSVAAAVALSACYPKQSSNILDQVYHRVKTEANNLFDKSDTTPSTIAVTTNDRKDLILHTTKSENQPIITVKGDYGQGTPADQHLYTTRGTSDPISSNSEKKH